MTKVLAYYGKRVIGALKRFIVQAIESQCHKTFFFIINDESKISWSVCPRRSLIFESKAGYY